MFVIYRCARCRELVNSSCGVNAVAVTVASEFGDNNLIYHVCRSCAYDVESWLLVKHIPVSCQECDSEPDDRVRAGMKCGRCAYK